MVIMGFYGLDIMTLKICKGGLSFSIKKHCFNANPTINLKLY